MPSAFRRAAKAIVSARTRMLRKFGRRFQTQDFVHCGRRCGFGISGYICGARVSGGSKQSKRRLISSKNGGILGRCEWAHRVDASVLPPPPTGTQALSIKRLVRSATASCSNHHPLDLIEPHLVAPALGFDPGRGRAPADHRIGVCLGQSPPGSAGGPCLGRWYGTAAPWDRRPGPCR